MSNSNLLSDIWNKFHFLIILYIVVSTITALFSLFMAWTMWSENVSLYSQHQLLTQELNSYKLNGLYQDKKITQTDYITKTPQNNDTAISSVSSNDTPKIDTTMKEEPQIQKKNLTVVDKAQVKPQIQKKEQKNELQKIQPVSSKIVQNTKNQSEKNQKLDITQPTLPIANLYIARHKENLEILLYGRHFLSADGYLYPKLDRYVITFKGECTVKLPKVDLSQLQIKSISTGKDINNNTTIAVDFYKAPQSHKLRYITPHTLEIILQ